MKPRIVAFMLCFTALAALAAGTTALSQSSLKITYGPRGVERLSYRDLLLEDLGQHPADIFHISHMKCTDLHGKVLAGGQYDWGENNNGRTWDAKLHKWTYHFLWGSISLQFAQAGDALNMTVTEVNAPNSGIILDGATLNPFVFHFPSLPLGFVNTGNSELASNTTGPSVTVADYGKGEVAAVVPDATRPLYSGFKPADAPDTYTPIVSTTTPDNVAVFFPRIDRPVAPGHTMTFIVSLRFAPSATGTANLASDVYRNWARAWPSELTWKDRRIIGTAYLATPPQGNMQDPGGYPSNPRRYFNDSNAADFDIRTTPGLSSFQERILRQAFDTVQNLKRLDAQGLITWDIEGEQYPQTTSYVCAPDEIARVAPEMESIVGSPASQYHGMKLDDAYFKVIREAGFRVGVCVRPQHFVFNANGTAGQTYLDDSQVAAELIRKIRYAHDRWGATLFYVDSTVQADGGVLNPSIFRTAAAAFPDSLLIPEETTPRFYAYAAAFKTFIFHNDLGTDPSVYNYYPHAFSAILVNDADPANLAKYESQLTTSVRCGDILMAHADYWQANNPTLLRMYRNASTAAQHVQPAPAAVAGRSCRLPAVR